MKSKCSLIFVAALTLCLGQASKLAAQGTAFTYQGRLTDGGSPANGLYEMQFTLFDALTNGNPVGTPVAVPPVLVTNGLFAVSLDFGAGRFDGSARWLEIIVNLYGSDAPPVTLSPRQPITSTPYSVFALGAGVASAVGSNAVGPGGLQNGAVTGAKIAPAQVVRSLNGLRDDVTLEAGANISFLTNGNNLRISASPGGLSGGIANGMQEFSMPGTNSFVVPAGVSKLWVELWGAGGGGGSGASIPYGGGGGGGGAGGYSRSIFSVTAEAVYEVVLGVGGAPRFSGGSSIFQTVEGAALLVSNGGSPGSTPSGSGGGLGGAGGAGDPQATIRRTGGAGLRGGNGSSASGVVGAGGAGGTATPGTVQPLGVSGGAGGPGNSFGFPGGHGYAILYW